jgi:hypothetical protein
LAGEVGGGWGKGRLLMAESNSLKGIAWDIFTPDGGKTLEIQRLSPLRDGKGGEAGPNDVFASDEAALEFVQQMALHGDIDCINALFLVRQSEDMIYEEMMEFCDLEIVEQQRANRLQLTQDMADAIEDEDAWDEDEELDRELQMVVDESTYQ